VGNSLTGTQQSCFGAACFLRLASWLFPYDDWKICKMSDSENRSEADVVLIRDSEK